MALVNNPLFARYFARFGGRNEERGNRELRKEMLAGLAGRVMEVGQPGEHLLPELAVAAFLVAPAEPGEVPGEERIVHQRHDMYLSRLARGAVVPRVGRVSRSPAGPPYRLLFQSRSQRSNSTATMRSSRTPAASSEASHTIGGPITSGWRKR